MYIGNVARPSNMIDYTLYETHALGILGQNNRQYIFMQGVALGLEFNR